MRRGRTHERHVRPSVDVPLSPTRACLSADPWPPDGDGGEGAPVRRLDAADTGWRSLAEMNIPQEIISSPMFRSSGTSGGAGEWRMPKDCDAEKATHFDEPLCPAFIVEGNVTVCGDVHSDHTVFVVTGMNLTGVLSDLPQIVKHKCTFPELNERNSLVLSADLYVSGHLHVGGNFRAGELRVDTSGHVIAGILPLVQEALTQQQGHTIASTLDLFERPTDAALKAVICPHVHPDYGHIFDPDKKGSAGMSAAAATGSGAGGSSGTGDASKSSKQYAVGALVVARDILLENAAAVVTFGNVAAEWIVLKTSSHLHSHCGTIRTGGSTGSFLLPSFTLFRSSFLHSLSFPLSGCIYTTHPPRPTDRPSGGTLTHSDALLPTLSLSLSLSLSHSLITSRHH
eukprot:GHVU01194939.1.p1 GENE.GHVU01194939.1~~GHVU01194939.1.p1  ORF type:complete len:399 (-),score=48.64 GHVU01194939.1:173-1369(-)